jgi:hypothetical protein
MKLRQPVEAEQALNNLASKQMPAALAYRIAMLMRQVLPHIQQFQRTRNELVNRLGGKPDEAGRITVLPENLPTFFGEVEKLLDEDVSIEVNPISLDDLEIEMSPMDVYALQWLLKPPE